MAALLAMRKLVPEVPKLSPECKKEMSKLELREYYRKRYDQAALARCERQYERAWDEVLKREQAMVEEAKMAKTMSTTDSTVSGSARSRSRSPADPDDDSWGGEVYELVVQYSTKFGEELYVIGSCPELGEWDLGKKVHMGWFEGNFWKVKVAIPKERKAVEYKFIIGHNGNTRWEGGSNHSFECSGGRRLLGQWQ
eukprot:s1010_g21.t2